MAAMSGEKVAPIELGEALLEQLALLEAVAVMLLEMAAAGGLVFFCCHEEIVERSGAEWFVGIESDIFWCCIDLWHRK